MNTFCPGVVSYTILLPFGNAPIKLSWPLVTSKISAPMALATKEVRIKTTFTLSRAGGRISCEGASIIKLLAQPDRTIRKTAHETILSTLLISAPVDVNDSFQCRLDIRHCHTAPRATMSGFSPKTYFSKIPTFLNISMSNQRVFWWG